MKEWAESTFICYNCGIEIIDINQKYCPNCGVILHPNDYINWRHSCYAFLCFLFIIQVVFIIILTIS